VAQLRDQRGEFSALGGRIITISFGPAAKAPAWLADTRSPFPLLIDARRKTYKAYGMLRSFRGSWNIATIRLYRQLMLDGREWRGIQGDSLQLGGDVIVDAAGIVRLLHPSESPPDRPSPSALLAALSELRGQVEPRI
jgi:alkyl hydroperoxide reductase subunit AhpC